MAQTKAESILAIDIGAAFTKASLFDMVAGEYRFLAIGKAPSTLYGADSDVAEGVVEAIRRLEAVTGRALLAIHGVIVPEQADGRGVDDCVLVSSAGSALRALIVASTAPRTAAMAAEVAAVPGVVVSGKGSLDAKLPRGESHLGLILSALERQRPHVVIVADGEVAKAGLGELAQALTISIRASTQMPPAVVFVGDEEAAKKLHATLPNSLTFYRVSSGTPLSGTALQERLLALWQENWRASVPGAAGLALLPHKLPLPAGQGFVWALSAIAGERQAGVWGLDVGARTTIGASVQSGAAVQGSGVALVTRPEQGTGQGSKAMLATIDSVQKWLDWASDKTATSSALLAKTFHPHKIPETTLEAALEGAVAREVASDVLGALPARRAKEGAVVVGSGGAFASAATIGKAMLLLLDCFQPVGMVELAVDRLGILSMLGGIAQQEPAAASALLAREGIERLGACIALTGDAKEDSAAAEVIVERGRQRDAAQVNFGQIKMLSLGEDETAKITVKPLGKLDCGAGPGRKATFAVRGGPAGVVIDARGRLRVPAARPDQPDLIAQWQRSLEV